MPNPVGAPPTKDYIAEAKAIDEWSKKEDSLVLQEFALERDIDPTTLYDWRDASAEFAQALKKAKARIAIRMQKKLHDKKNPLNYGVYNRYIGFHDELLNKHERSEKEFESKLKKENESQRVVIFYDRDPTRRDQDTDPA